MKFSAVLAAVAMAAVGSAQLEALPTCAYSCLISSPVPAGCADLFDYPCVCSSQPFIDAAISCIEGACTPEDIIAAREATIVLCRENGVELNLPPYPPSRIVRRN